MTIFTSSHPKLYVGADCPPDFWIWRVLSNVSFCLLGNYNPVLPYNNSELITPCVRLVPTQYTNAIVYTDEQLCRFGTCVVDQVVKAVEMCYGFNFGKTGIRGLTRTTMLDVHVPKIETNLASHPGFKVKTRTGTLRTTGAQRELLQTRDPFQIMRVYKIWLNSIWSQCGANEYKTKTRPRQLLQTLRNNFTSS